MESLPACLSKFFPHAMLDYLFQHFYSTLAIFSFCIAILILRALGKRSIFWIPVSTAPLGCITFLAVFLLLTAFIIGTFGFFTTIPIAENLAFALACRSDRYFTPDRLLPAAGTSRRQALSGGIWKNAVSPAPEQRHPAIRHHRHHQLRH